MPIADFKNFDDCVNQIKTHNNPNTGQPYGEEIAKKICGKIAANQKAKGGQG